MDINNAQTFVFEGKKYEVRETNRKRKQKTMREQYR